MTQRYVYDNGTPFSEPLNKNLEAGVDRVRKHKPVLWIIDGLQGEGKTTIGVHIMDFINHLNGQPTIDLHISHHPQLSMGAEQFIKHLKMAEEEKIIVITYDEAGDFNKRGALSKLNQALNRIFSRFRAFNVIVIMILPNFNILDNWLFDNGIPRGLIHCHDRTMKQGNFSAYSLPQMMWIRYWYNKLPQGIKYQCYSHVSPNFRGHFLDLPQDRQKLLDRLSTTSKKDSLEMESIKLEGLLSYYDIAAEFGKSVIWVKKLVHNLKIKPDRIFKGKKYFNNSIVERLNNEM